MVPPLLLGNLRLESRHPRENSALGVALLLTLADVLIVRSPWEERLKRAWNRRLPVDDMCAFAVGAVTRRVDVLDARRHLAHDAADLLRLDLLAEFGSRRVHSTATEVGRADRRGDVVPDLTVGVVLTLVIGGRSMAAVVLFVLVGHQADLLAAD